jgi:citrate lyase subunit beta / citryl-CoA lyase
MVPAGPSSRRIEVGLMVELDPRRDPGWWTTLLFVPADKPEMLAKAQSRKAEAIIIDLEDAIAVAAKEAARAILAHELERGALVGPSAICVRINPLDQGGIEDLEALSRRSIDAIITPKADSQSGVSQVREAIDSILPAGPTVSLIPQVESARGVVQLHELAAARSIAAIAFGGEDLCVDLGVPRSEDSLELLIPRALVALHARAVGLPAIDTVYTAVDDDDGLTREATVARKLGFTGKLLIHPAQIDPVRRVFSPTEGEVRWAHKIIDIGVSTNDSDDGVRLVDGKMVDAPVVAQAQRILARTR